MFLLYGLVFGPTQKTIGAWLGVLAIQVVCAAYAFRLDKERMTHLISLPLQQILYRQLMYVVLLQSWITALTGGRLRWQKLRRTGVVAAPGGPVPAAGGGPARRDGGRSDDAIQPTSTAHRGRPAEAADGRGTSRSSHDGAGPGRPRDRRPAVAGPRSPAGTGTSTCCAPLALVRVVVYHLFGLGLAAACCSRPWA